MRLNRFTAVLPLVGGALAQDRPPADREEPAVVAKAYILEYSQASLRKRQEEVSNTPGIEVVKSFDSSIFAGVSVKTEEFNIDTLAALPDVLKVWINEYVELAPVEIKIPDEAASALNYNIHNATGVNKLHELGIFGKGAKVGVVDTGIEYTHPALGAGFGPGFKVAGGWDFVGDGPTLGAPDEDPIDYQGHGSHVAGTIAGKTENWQGVAPEATLYAYKVFANSGGTSIDVLIEAFLAAYNDGVDIITASIGSLGGWSDNAWGEVASRLVEEGVVITISAGNSGSAGPFYGSSGSSGKNVLAVASSTTEVFPTFPFLLTTVSKDGESETTKNLYVPERVPFPATVKGWPVVPLSNDTTIENEACTPYPAGSPRLTGTIPLVRRGGCTFNVKVTNLEARGATYILAYNNDSPIVVPSHERVNGRVGLISAEAGVAIVKAVSSGAKVTAEFLGNSDEIYAVQYEGGGRPSAFTSWGALFDLQIKPDIAAPGGDIYSAWVGKNYRIISGTSMACPYVAGVAALWVGQNGGRSVHGKGWARELYQRIVSSGTTLPWSDGTPTDFGYPASVVQIGNGLVNGWKVVKYDTRLEFDKIALNDTRYFNRYHDVSVINNSEEPVTYTWAIEYAAGIESYGLLPSVAGGSTYRLKSYSELRPSTFEVGVSLPKAFTLQSGESKVVSVNFRNPDTLGWNAASLPLYSGKVFVTGSNGDKLSVPFFGVGADLRHTLDLSHTNYPRSYSGPDSVSIEQNSSYSFDLGAQYYPRVETRYTWGSRELRWDVFEAGWTERQWKYPPVVGQNGYVGSVAAWVYTYPTFEPAFGDDPEQTFSFPLRNTARHAEIGNQLSRYSWFGKLANGTQVAKGHYNLRFAVLKPFGRPEAADNWDVYKTPRIQVTGQY